MTVITPEDVLKFWFVESGEELWFGGGDDFDIEIRTRFGAATHKARDGAFERWVETSHHCLALIILIDQFSRNIHRHSPLAWSADPHALAVCKLALERDYGDVMDNFQRTFLYMPLMHSEVLEDQVRSVEFFRAMSDSGIELNTRSYKSALRHHEIIERFGRFPHRNETLNRDSTAAELAFLEEPNSSF